VIECPLDLVLLLRTGVHRPAPGRLSEDAMVSRAAALVVGVHCALAASLPATAQEWPTGTVRVILPVTAGGPLDLPARLLIDRLAAQTKGSFILEHRGGAGGSISAQAVVQAAPDGNTLLFTTSSLAAAPAFYPKLGFDPRQALVPISLITETPTCLMLRAGHPIRDLLDLIAKAKAQPGKYTFGSGGVGTGNHLAGEFLKKMAGIDLLHVPFRGVSLAMTRSMPAISTSSSPAPSKCWRMCAMAAPACSASARRRGCRSCRTRQPSQNWCRATARPIGMACSARAACRTPYWRDSLPRSPRCATIRR
jgi:hypothetical protein